MYNVWISMKYFLPFIIMIHHIEIMIKHFLASGDIIQVTFNMQCIMNITLVPGGAYVMGIGIGG